MSFALTSNAPRKIPGKASTLLIWFGKSLLPVPTTAAPAFFARSGIISGTGFAIGKRIGFSAMDFTISSVTAPGADTPINTSAPLITSSRLPFSLSRLQIFAISCFSAFKPSRPS